MNNRPLRITVLGNYSGKNAGDAAILTGLLRDISESYRDRNLLFLVPTTNPRFIEETYSRFPVRAVSLRPQRLSLKFLGLPLIRAVDRADLVLVTDSILFDRRLYNPLFNYLHTLSWVLPGAARRGIPVVLYCVSLGPIDTPAGRECLTRVLHSAANIITRETVSIDLVRELHPRGPRPVLAADCALSVLPAPLDEVHDLLRSLDFPEPRRPLLGFNVGVLSGKQAPFSTEHFERVVAQTLDRAVRELEVSVLMCETQPLDLPVARGVLRRMAEGSHAGLASHPLLGHAQLTGLLGQVEAFVGMRTHSLILASSMHTPVSGIVAYPKTRGYLQSIGREDGMLELAQFSAETLWSLISEIWHGRDSLRVRLAADVERERDRALKAAAQLSSWLGPPRPVTRSSGLALLRESAGKRPRG